MTGPPTTIPAPKNQSAREEHHAAGITQKSNPGQGSEAAATIAASVGAGPRNSKGYFQQNTVQDFGSVEEKTWQEAQPNNQENRPYLLRRPASHPVTSGTLTKGSRASSGKKRAAPPDFVEGTVSSETSSKRPRLRPKPDKIPDLPSFSKPHKQDETAVSPLFFSHNPRQRPTLPRFSSSEAGAAMMKKATVEDSSSNIRTVKLARGSITSINPQRATSTPSRRYPSERQTLSRIASPDEKELALKSLQSLSQVGILELLEQDDRLIFIIDLGNSSNFQPGLIYTVYANGPLKAYGFLFDMIRGKVLGDVNGLTGTAGFSEFKAWATSFVQDGEALDVSLPTFSFCGASWTCSTLRNRFRIFYGVLPSGSAGLISNPPTVSSNSSDNHNSNLPHTASTPVRTLASEPFDYFGKIEHNPLPNDLDEPNENVLSSVETPSIATKPTPASHDKSESIPSIGLSMKLHSSAASPNALSATDASAKISDQGIASPTSPSSTQDQGFFDWTRLPFAAALPRHIQFARSIDWGSTSLGPIETWPPILRSTCNLLMASPHPAAMYWGEDNVILYNEPYILLAGQKHPKLMGQTYHDAWSEIWQDVKDSFVAAKITGQSTMKDDDRLFVNRSGFLEETYFSWSLIPLVGPDGNVVGLFNPVFEKTRRKIAERRMLTLREVGETTAAAREVRAFWPHVLKGLQYNEYDTPFVLLYSVADETDSDASSIHSNSILGARSCVLEGTLPAIPSDHPAAPSIVDLKTGAEGFGTAFREAMMVDKPVLLETSNGTLNQDLLEGFTCRGFPEKPKAAIVCPIHPTTGDSINGFLVMGINPRRDYDDDYSLFVQLLSRQLATSLASVALFEEEIKRGQRAAKLAALDRIELSEQLAARTMEAVESETKFTRMAELVPVGMFIANREGRMIFTNDTFQAVSGYPKEVDAASWMETVKDEDKDKVQTMWDDLIHKKNPVVAEFRFKTPWKGPNGSVGETWVLSSAYPEKDAEGNLKSAFGSLTNISQQKWAEDFQKKRMEEAVELKRQQSNFIDMTSHEMRNPLSAILQCADEISGSLLEFKASPGDFHIPTSLLDNSIDAAQTIALCANHQTRIVSDVLTLSKLDSALLLVTPVDVRPASIVQQTLKMFEGELHTADIKMEFKIDSSIDELRVDWVRLDPSRLLQVLINLTTNAIKFTTGQAKRTIIITLSAFSDPPPQLPTCCVSYIPSRSQRMDVTDGKDWGGGDNVYLNFAVQDTGKGLTEDEKKLLFLRFSQASPKTHVQYGGSGLGLFISRELVELQGGEIGVSSERGRGSTFAFYVKARKSQGPPDSSDLLSSSTNPLRKSSMNRLLKSTSVIRPTMSNESLSTATVPKPLGRLRILIVEDNLVNQRVLSKQLQNQGCIVSVANHGGECIEQLKQTKFWKGHEADSAELDLILMDLEMPVMDGLTCTKTIRDLQKSKTIVRPIPIIAVSANARNAHIESALEAGMDDVVSKPFRIPELMPKIEQLVGRSTVK